MFNETSLKVIPVVVFLFCLLEIFELVLIITDMNKTEKLEVEIKNNLKVLGSITIPLNKYLESKQLEHFENKKIQIK